MIPAAFDYHRPASVSEAIGLLGELGDDALVVAGGHSLIPMMKLRMATPEHLVDLQGVDELKQISIDQGVLTIGAMVTQAQMLASADVGAACPILGEASRQIADPQIRNLGTLGGNVANGDPGNDMPAVMQALDATYVVVGADGERTVAARDFYEAAFFTAREDGELLTAIKIPVPPSGHGSAYVKQKRKVGDYATSAAAVILTMDGGTCSAASIALTNVGDTPLFAEAASKALKGNAVDEASINAAAEAAMAITEPVSDGRGSSEFRTWLTGVMVRRAIQAAAERAKG